MCTEDLTGTKFLKVKDQQCIIGIGIYGLRPYPITLMKDTSQVINSE